MSEPHRPASDRSGSGTFEDRLLNELQAYVAQRPPEAPERRSRRPLVAAAAAAAVLAGGAVIVPTVLLGDHGHAAYAVQRQHDGRVSLRVQGVIAVPAKMERDLASAGAPVKVIPAQAGRCQAVHAPLQAPAGMLSRTGPATFVIDPDKIPRGTTLIAQVPVRGHQGPLRLMLS
ncbi:MAG TPA: hypothetical protein VHC49_19705, partial [Mycobacteriales bacterium]|nr:hypothetical protein [Mycobacteriales bacterium]